jgi:hypothetical protein
MAAPARRVALVAGLGLAAALLTGCSADRPAASATASSTGSAGASEDSSPAASSSSSTKPGPTESETTPATVAPPLPQPVGSVTKVKRSSGPSKPSVSAPAAPFSSAVKYPDGVTLTIVKAERGTETGHGAGVMAGRQYVRFQLKLTNGSARPINLNEVVVTTYYGTSRQNAAPVYTESAHTYDFSGTVAKGGSATAYYAFAVPTKNLNKVTMVVDFDGLHTSATYTGAVVAS